MTTNKLNAQEMYGFCSQLGLILKSGLPLFEGLESIAMHDADDTYLKQIAQDVASGDGFHDALAHSGRFEDTFLDMVEVGEKSGHLDQMMEANALYYQRMYQTNQKIKQMIVYPFLLGTLLLAVMAIVLLYVLPIFQNLLEQMQQSLPGFAITLMDIAQTIGSIGFFVFLVLLIIAGFWYMQKRQSQLQYQLPFMKDLSYKLGLSQMTYALSLLLSSGYQLEETFALLKKLTKDTTITKKLDACEQAIQQGISFEDALMQQHVYDGIEEKILYAGCKSGNAELALKQLALLQEEHINEDIIQRLDALEPTMVAIISMFVTVLLLSIVLPMMSILSSIG